MIQQLDPQTTLQMAAGEVITRPSAVVKEVLENAIDAKSNDITIDIENSGIASITISDNGHGIGKEQLQLALTRHATSKIQNISDLNHIRSMGFRGEALASICAIAKVKLTSKTKEQSCGWSVSIQGSDATKLEPRKAAHHVGTTIEISDLFFNTPVRKKFLSSDRTEFQHILDVFKKLALANPHISFKLTHNGKLHTQTCTNHSVEEKLSTHLSSGFSEDMIEINAQDGDTKLTGWIAKPTYTRSQTDQQYIFLNKRYIKDKGLYYAVKRAYIDVLHGDRQPAYVLMLDIDPSIVDVNVHPTKEQVRFQQPQPLYQWVKRAVEYKLSQRLVEARPVNDTIPQTSTPTAFKPVNKPSSAQYKHTRPSIEPISKNQHVDAPISMTSIPTKSLITHHASPTVAPKLPVDKTTYDEQPKPIDVMPSTPLGMAIGQIKQTFILAENNDGLILVDMHAAHERILYEQLKNDYSGDGIKSQALLLPVCFSLNDQQLECIETNALFFEQLGFRAQQIGQNQLQVTHMPMLLKDSPIAELLEKTIDEFIEHKETINEAVNQILSTMACHSAIRHGRRLSNDEMNLLLRQIEKTEKSNYCNHGRPTWKCLNMKELDRMFKRGQ